MRIKAPVSQKELGKLLKVPGVHAVGGCPGLYISVAEEGDGRSWILRLPGTRRPMGLGSFIDFTLAEARERGLAQRCPHHSLPLSRTPATKRSGVEDGPGPGKQAAQRRFAAR